MRPLVALTMAASIPEMVGSRFSLPTAACIFSSRVMMAVALMTEGQGFNHHRFGNFIRGRFDHDNGVT